MLVKRSLSARHVGVSLDTGMSSRLISCAIWSVGIGVLILFVAVYAFGVYTRRNLVYPTSETKSSFLRDYDPKRAVEMFMTDGYGWGSAIGSSAGEGVVENESSFHGDLTIHPQESEALMINLKNNLLWQLHSSGASVNQSGDISHGYRVDYELGKSVGSVAIAPLRPNPRKRSGYLAPGSTEVLLEMTIHERWSPQG